MELLVLSFLVLLVFLHGIWRCLRPTGRLPPGPVGLPLLGRLPFLQADLPKQFADHAHSYGSVLSLRLGTTLFVVVGSAAAAAEVLNDVVFANHSENEGAKELFAGADVPFAPYGPLWRMLRKMAVRELLSPTAIGSFLPLRRREMQRMLEGLQASSGRAADVRAAVYAYTVNVMMGMVWAEALEEGTAKGMERELREVMEKVMEVLTVPNISDYLPWLAPLDLQGVRRRAKGLMLQFSTILDCIIDRKASSNDGAGGRDGADGGAKDFLQLMLDLVGKEDPDVPLEKHHMRNLVMDMILGGTDTTSTTVEWAMAELVGNPTVMAKVQEELDAVVGHGGILEESHLPKLHYLDAVMRETLRLHPVFPLLLGRSPSETCSIGGYRISKGTTVYVNAWAIQRDPSIWAEPLEFRPERFLLKEGLGKKLRMEELDCYLPFGGGRRACAGQIIAERMVKYMLGSLLHSFCWRLPDGVAAVDMEGELGIVFKKKEPLSLVPSARGSCMPL